MNILIINPFGIGDVLFTTPVIRALKEKFPFDKIGYLCNKRTEPIIKTNPYVNKVFVYERDDFKRLQESALIKWAFEFRWFIRSIRQEKYDAAVDFSLAANLRFLLWLSKIKKRVGYDYRNKGFYLTNSLKLDGYHDRHMVEYYSQVLSLLGISVTNKKLELFLDNEDKAYAEEILKKKRIEKSKLIISISPCGGASWGKDAALKHWNIENYRVLIDKLIEKYAAQIIILGDQKEKEALFFLENKLKYPVINLGGQTTLGQFAAVVGQSQILITNDGGPLHIAVALGKKTVSFFGPVDPKVYGPYPPDESRHIVLRKELECSPCYKNFRMPACQRSRECLESIKPEEALEAVGKLLRDSF